MSPSLLQAVHTIFEDTQTEVVFGLRHSYLWICFLAIMQYQNSVPISPSQNRIKNFLSFLRRCLHNRKVHHFDVSDNIVYYTIEKILDHPAEYLMTANHFGVKQNDIIKFHGNTVCKTYQVLDIDYYADPPGMWSARLIDFVE